MSTTNLDRLVSSSIASLVHCNPSFYCIKRCRHGVRICHRCPKGTSRL